MGDAATIIIVCIVCAACCFIAVQVRGCNQDANAYVQDLAKQGIRATVTPNGHLDIIDARDFRQVEKEQK